MFLHSYKAKIVHHVLWVHRYPSLASPCALGQALCRRLYKLLNTTKASIVSVTSNISSLSRDQVRFDTAIEWYEPSIVCAEVAVAIFSQPWDHPEFLVQTIIDFRRYNLQQRKSLANTLNPFRSLLPQTHTQKGRVEGVMQVRKQIISNGTIQYAKKYTEMRLRKMIRSSGTPFLIRRSIAWATELPAK